MRETLTGLGFAGVEETALGAATVKKQYDALVNRNTGKAILSTCCPTVNLLIRKYYPAAIPYAAPVLSPMQAHCMDLKRRYPGAKTVFIGPCISKKAEADDECPGARRPVDCVLTFNELSAWLQSRGLEPGRGAEAEEGGADRDGNTLTRLFPLTGGILRSMAKENRNYAYLAIDGIDNCVKVLEDLGRGGLGNCFIEMSACAGSCVGGPAMGKARENPVRSYLAVNASAGSGDFAVQDYPPEALSRNFGSLRPGKIHAGSGAAAEVLKKMGKTRPEDELNCGCCGYNTCRDKAQAVLEGKANIEMCLPWLKERAESFSDNIIRNTPNGIIVLNESFEVQQINASACRMMNIKAADILGDQVVRILDPAPFMEAVQKEQNSYNRQVFLADYKKYVEQSVVYDKNHHIIIGIMRDVTGEMLQREAKEELNRKTLEISGQVIEKQMRTVQEIASLLGETAAETKIALTKLTESLAGSGK
jgi:PAS domain-containing protein